MRGLNNGWKIIQRIITAIDLEMFCGVFHFSFFKALSVAYCLTEPAESKAAYWSLLKMNSSPNYEGRLRKWVEQACILTCMCLYTAMHRYACIFMYIYIPVWVYKILSQIPWNITNLPLVNGIQLLRWSSCMNLVLLQMNLAFLDLREERHAFPQRQTGRAFLCRPGKEIYLCLI